MRTRRSPTDWYWYALIGVSAGTVWYLLSLLFRA